VNDSDGHFVDFKNGSCVPSCYTDTSDHLRRAGLLGSRYRLAKLVEIDSLVSKIYDSMCEFGLKILILLFTSILAELRGLNA